MTKISMDKEYTTRDGQPVRVLCVDRIYKKVAALPIVALVKGVDGTEEVRSFTEEGFYYPSKTPSPSDLVEKKKEVTLNYVKYLVVDGEGLTRHVSYTKSDAEAYAKCLRNVGTPCGVATISIPLTVTIE